MGAIVPNPGRSPGAGEKKAYMSAGLRGKRQQVRASTFAMLSIDLGCLQVDDPVAMGAPGARDRRQTMADVLDGRRFDGVVLECGKTAGDADSLIFDNGRFRSTACDRYEYGDGAYTVKSIGDGLAFSAETESPKYGTL